MTDHTHAMIIGDDGTPTGIVDIARIQCDATVLMYRFAAAAGDNAAVDAVAIEFMHDRDADEIGYVTAAAMSLITRHVLAPVLDVLDEVAPTLGFRAKLAESRDNAIRELG
jgi:hypothetical protein